MSTLAEDIADVYAEIGSRIQIWENSQWTDDQYIDTEQDMGNPYLRRAFFPASSAAVAGSVVRIASVNADFLVLSKVPAVFENGPYEYECLLFMANVTAQIVRLTHARDPVSYQQTVVETEIVNPAYGFMSPGSVTLSIGRIGNIVINANDLYVPASYDVQSGDRVRIGAEVWQVTTVRTRDYPGIAIAALAEDTR
jgi:hypothetical protein